jgi:hypothetical protein
LQRRRTFNFSVAAPFVQWMGLGVIAMEGGSASWSGRHQEAKFSNNSAANQYLKPNSPQRLEAGVTCGQLPACHGRADVAEPKRSSPNLSS